MAGLVEDVLLGKSKRKKHRDRMRYLLWKLKRQERSRMLHESFWDKRACELVAVDNYFLHDVGPGEVLFDRRGFVTPSLGVF